MIKAIIFDYGGVISQHTDLAEFAKQYAHKHDIDGEAFSQLLKSLWIQARVDGIATADFVHGLAEFADVPDQVFAKDFCEHFGFNEQVYAIAKGLKGKYKLVILSNTIRLLMEYNVRTYHLHDVFDHIITSYERKKAKPDTTIFSDTLAMLGITPSEAVYIDDMRKNVVPAREFGLQVIHFESARQLKEELKKLL